MKRFFLLTLSILMIGIIATSCQNYELDDETNKSSKESLLYGTWTLKENQNIFDGINTKYTFNENHTGAIRYLGYDYDENGNVHYVPKGYDFTWELKNDAIIISYLVGGGNIGSLFQFQKINWRWLMKV